MRHHNGTFTSVSPLRGVAALVVLAAGLSCSDGGPVSPWEGHLRASVGAPALVDEYAGENQTERAGLAVGTDPTVRVTDAAGAPVPGVAVRFVVTKGGGHLWAPGDDEDLAELVVTTDADGLAAPRAWWLGPLAGEQELHAWVEGLLPAILWATAVVDTEEVPAAERRLEKVEGDGQTEEAGLYVGTDPTVRVTDEHGNPLPGVAVAFDPSGDGVAEGTPAVSDAEGLASVNWRLATTAGRNTLTVSTAGGASVAFGATGTAGEVGGASGGAGVIEKVAGDAQSVENGEVVAVPPKVRVTDEHGNGAAGVEVAFEITLGGGDVQGSPATTDDEGYASIESWRVGTVAGPTRLTATVEGVGSVVFGATVLAGEAEGLVKTAGDGQSAVVGTTVAVAPEARVTDDEGNPIAGVEITFAVSGGDGSVTGSSATTDADGRASVGSWTLGSTAGANTLTASASGLGSVTFAAVGLPGTAHRLAIVTQPASTSQSGAAFAQQPEVRIRDADGNDVALAGVAVTATIASGGGALGGTTKVTTDAGGRAAFADLSISGLAGDRTLGFTASGLVGATSQTITVGPGAAAVLGVTTQPSASAKSGSVFAEQPVVQLRDAAGNSVNQAGVDVTVAIATGGGTLGGPATVATDATGKASFAGLSITGSAGNRTLAFTAPGLGSATSDPIAVSPATPTLTSIGPDAGVQGATVAVTLTGTDFMAGATVAVSGTGVTVDHVVVVSATSMTADFVVDPAATIGVRSVTVTTAGGTSGAQTFTVNQGPPTLTSVGPAAGVRGTTVNVTLTGTRFLAGATVAVAGGGVATSNVTVVSSTTITADLVIDPTAARGARSVTVTTTGGTSGALTFTVQQSQTFPYKGEAQYFKVPAGVTSITIEAQGAQGGGASQESGSTGGFARATVAVTPDEKLAIFVGGRGTHGGAGGFNGGGEAGRGGGSSTWGGSGGGASDVRQGGEDLEDRIVVAGGGAGAGGMAGAGRGGAGGPETGANGRGGTEGVEGGTGGTQDGGGGPGRGAKGGGDGSAGLPGTGGAGGEGAEGSGGGGGGGYYGGGGGGAHGGAGHSAVVGGGGGGGGSSFAIGTATDVTLVRGGNTGHGQVVIIW